MSQQCALLSSYSYVQGVDGGHEDGAELLSVVASDRTKGSKYKIENRRVYFNLRRKLLT